MLDQLTVTPSRLATAATNIEAAAKEIDEILAQLESDAATLRTQWSGDAQVAFDLAHDRFADSLASRTAVVKKISTALKALADGYSDLDLESARALGAAS